MLTYSLIGQKVSETFGRILQYVNGDVYNGFGEPVNIGSGGVGPQGQVGNTGSVGPQGQVGNTGSVGPQGQVGNTGSVGATGAGGALGYYGSFYDTTTQTNPTASTANIMYINSTSEANGINNDGSSKIIFEYPGVYNLQFSAQFQKTSNGDSVYDLWLRKNGTDVVWSNSQITLTKTGSNNPYNIASWNFVITLAANDYIQLMWSSSDTSVTITTLGTQSNPTRPAIPSVIFTAQQVMYLQLGATGSTGATGPSYNFNYGLTVSGLTVSVDTSIIATTATLSNYATINSLNNYALTATLSNYATVNSLDNYALTATLSNYATITALNTHFSNGGDSFGATATIGTLDNRNMQIILNNTLVARFLTQSVNTTTGPGSTVFVIYGNTATASSVLGPTGTNMWIQGISTQAGNTSLLTTFNSGAGSGNNRPHIRMVNGAGQATFMGMADNAQSIVFGNNSNTYLTLNSGGSTWASSASGAAQNSITINAAHANSAGTSIGLLLNNTGNNSSTGGVTTFRINNTETLSGSGTHLLMDAQRSSNTVFKIDMAGAISAGTVSNATQSSWKLGKVITTASVVDTTRYVEINIDGAIVKLAVIS